VRLWTGASWSNMLPLNHAMRMKLAQLVQRSPHMPIRHKIIDRSFVCCFN